MKFAELPLGDTFIYQDEPYVKTSPIMARPLDGGEQRLISRSAAICKSVQRPLSHPQLMDANPAYSGRALLDSFMERCLTALTEAADEHGRVSLPVIRATMQDVSERLPQPADDTALCADTAKKAR